MSKSRTLLKSFSVTAFAVLGLSLSSEALAANTFQRNVSPYDKACSYLSSISGWTKRSTTCTTATVGGAITYIEHHDMAMKCTWSKFEGEVVADPGEPGNLDKPIVVTQKVGTPGDPNDKRYATCSGWSVDGLDGYPKAPTPFTPDSHQSAPYGWGLYWFQVEYKSTAAIGCEDANSGIGNNCGTFTDAQNKKHNSGITLTGAAERMCENISSTATKMTYKFSCGDGVAVSGYLTLVPTIDVNGVPAPQSNPSGTAGSITNCTPERIAAGKCTMQYGGIPQKLITKGKNSYYVVDTDACKAAFPGGVSISNALDSGQTQVLPETQLLQYTEVAQGTQCDTSTRLPTFVPPDPNVAPPDSFAQGTPTSFFGRYCQSDIGKFSDNLTGNLYGNDWLSGNLEGFDNELRICPLAGGHYHTGQQDVEKVGGTALISVINQPNTNIACGGAGTNDSGVFKVWIPNQTSSDYSLDNANIMLGSAAPKLFVAVKKNPGDPDAFREAVGSGVSPTGATPNVLLSDGRLAMELTYSRCNGLNPAIYEAVTGGYLTAGTSPVWFVVKGETESGAGLDLAVQFTGPFQIDVNWGN